MLKEGKIEKVNPKKEEKSKGEEQRPS